MKVDPSKSVYHESPDARNEFTVEELRSLRLLLRRLRFLENQVRENKVEEGSGGAMFAQWEVIALEFVLGPDGLEFLGPKELPHQTGKTATQTGAST